MAYYSQNFAGILGSALVKDHARQESKCDTDRKIKVSNSCVYLLARVYIKDVPSQGSKTDLPVDLFLQDGYFHK